MLVPVFFVLMGLRIDLASVRLAEGAGTGGGAHRRRHHREAGVRARCAMPGVNRLAVGIGMIPRGEVGLIFASVGAGIMLDGQL